MSPKKENRAKFIEIVDEFPFLWDKKEKITRIKLKLTRNGKI